MLENKFNEKKSLNGWYKVVRICFRMLENNDTFSLIFIRRILHLTHTHACIKYEKKKNPYQTYYLYKFAEFKLFLECLKSFGHDLYEHMV